MTAGAAVLILVIAALLILAASLHSGLPEPVKAVDAALRDLDDAANSFCATAYRAKTGPGEVTWLGQRLPTDDPWVKVATKQTAYWKNYAATVLEPIYRERMEQALQSIIADRDAMHRWADDGGPA